MAARLLLERDWGLPLAVARNFGHPHHDVGFGFDGDAVARSLSLQ